MWFIKKFFNIRNSYIRGKHTEKKAKQYLCKNGWEILSMNYKTKLGEIDIIAKKDIFLVAFEVKYRDDKDILHYSISKKQQYRISRSLLLFQKNKKNYMKLNLRFDVLLFSKNYFQHLENAW